MMVEHKAVDAGIAQPGLRPGQADDVVGAQQLLHPRSRLASGRRPALDLIRSFYARSPSGASTAVRERR